MTDKQIIIDKDKFEKAENEPINHEAVNKFIEDTNKFYIDGVDVSGCRYLFDDTSYKRSKTSCSITLKDCKYLGNNCYYKQLKRKEQELNKAKQIILQAVDDFSLEYGTPYYNKLLESAKLLGIEVKDYE